MSLHPEQFRTETDRQSDSHLAIIRIFLNDHNCVLVFPVYMVKVQDMAIVDCLSLLSHCSLHVDSCLLCLN